MCAQIPFTICATWRAQINMRKLMCSSFSAKLNYGLRSPATICGKHLTQTEVEICADVSMCREVSANYLRRTVGADSIYILRYLQVQTNVRKLMCGLVGRKYKSWFAQGCCNLCETFNANWSWDLCTNYLCRKATTYSIYILLKLTCLDQCV